MIRRARRVGDELSNMGDSHPDPAPRPAADAIAVAPPEWVQVAEGLVLQSPFPACLVRLDSAPDVCNDPFRELVRTQLPHGASVNADWRAVWQDIATVVANASSGETAQMRLSSWHRADPSPQIRQLLFCGVPVRASAREVGGVLLSVHDVSATAELERVNRDLEAMNYSLSHDLQTPIGTLRELIRIVLEDVSLSDETRSLLGYATTGAAQLGQRVEGLVRLARTMRAPLKYVPIDMTHLVENTLQSLVQNSVKPVNYKVGTLPSVMGDRELLTQALSHVLANAIKFTKDVTEPRIEIGAGTTAGQVAYKISDNGVGFDMKYAHKLFGLFQRLHSDPRFDGAGVGLALARCIVERHGGTLQATAEKQKGATFCITLPVLDASQ
jgi:signal transduction histidine kinase